MSGGWGHSAHQVVVAAGAVACRLYKGLTESGRYTMPDTVKGAVLCRVATAIALSAGGGR